MPVFRYLHNIGQNRVQQVIFQRGGVGHFQRFKAGINAALESQFQQGRAGQRIAQRARRNAGCFTVVFVHDQEQQLLGKTKHC